MWKYIRLVVLVLLIAGFNSCASSQRIKEAPVPATAANAAAPPARSDKMATTKAKQPAAKPVKTGQSASTAEGTVPTKDTITYTSLAISTVRYSEGYPAMQYYGNQWNMQHIRCSADPRPVGATELILTEGAENFVMPTCGKVLSEFGRRNGRMHTGIDLKLQLNDPVFCAFDGMVRMAQPYAAYGNVVVVRHENGLETVYSHLNRIAVNVDQRVKAGDVLGSGGRTGRATGVHLHFETRFMGEPFNPRLLIDFEQCLLGTNTLALNEESYTLFGKNLAATKQTTTLPPELEETTEAVPQTHIVQKGDTLYNLSRRYNTTVAALQALNSMGNSTALKIGQKLVVQ